MDFRVPVHESDMSIGRIHSALNAIVNPSSVFFKSFLKKESHTAMGNPWLYA
jgi:hypothetical protein